MTNSRTATANVSTTQLDVRCSSPDCGTSGRGKLLFRISPDHKTIYAYCPRGHEQAIELDKLPVHVVG